MTENDFFKYLRDKEIQDYIVSLRYKYSWEDDWNYSNEILEWEPSLTSYVWNVDWDEGYDEVEVLGCIPIADIKVPNNLKGV